MKQAFKIPEWRSIASTIEEKYGFKCVAFDHPVIMFTHADKMVEIPLHIAKHMASIDPA